MKLIFRLEEGKKIDDDSMVELTKYMENKN